MDLSGRDSAVLMLEIPASALCGIDLLSFTPSPRFRGVRNIHAGFHFIFTGASATLSVRQGIWIKIEASGSIDGIIIIKKWDSEREELVDEPNPAEQMRWKANIGSIWNEGLTPYRQSVPSTNGEEGAVEGSNDWGRLTSHITPALLSRITCGQQNNWILNSASTAEVDMESIPGLSSDEDFRRDEKPLHFLPINLKQTWREGAVGRERTEAANDRSWALENLIKHHCSEEGETQIVGELQMTYLMVLTLENYSCLEQWKRMLNLVLTCRSATNARPHLFIRILSTLKLQLQHHDDVDGGLFDFNDEGGALLKRLLKSFRRGLGDQDNKISGVMDELLDLEHYVKAEYGWELSDSYVRKGILELEDGEQVEMEVSDLEGEDERGEYAPVILEMKDTLESTFS